MWYPCMRFTMKALAAAALGLPWSSLMVVLYKAMLWLCHGYVMALLWLLLWLLHQKGERLCFGCHASQERINIYAVPMAPGIFLQLPRSHLTYLDSTNSVNSETAGSTVQITLCERLTKLFTEYAPFVKISIFISSNKITHF